MKESERFNKEFFTTGDQKVGKGPESCTRDKLQTRNKDCGHYYQVAYFVNHYFHDLKMIEVGSGMGWITRHLKNHHQDIVGFDISQWAADNAVCDDIFCADLLTIDTKKWQRELVVCSNVMGYFEKEEVLKAIEQLGKLFTKYAVVVLQTRENIVRNFGEEVMKNKEQPRRTFESWDWWKEQFATKGLILGKKHAQLADDPKAPVRLVPRGDGRPTMFILEHWKEGTKIYV